MKTIGERFKFLRQKLGMTQVEFAKSIKVSQGTLSDIEKNKTSPSADTLSSVVRYFSANANWLLAGENNHIYETGQKIISEDPREYHLNSDKLSHSEFTKSLDEYMNYAEALGKHIQHIRLSNGSISEEEFAKSIEISIEDLSAYEKGLKPLPLYVAYKIITEYDVYPEFILNPGSVVDKEYIERNDESLTAAEQKLICMYRKFPKDHQEEVNEIVLVKYKMLSKNKKLSNFRTGNDEEAATRELA